MSSLRRLRQSIAKVTSLVVETRVASEDSVVTGPEEDLPLSGEIASLAGEMVLMLPTFGFGFRRQRR